LGASNSVRCPGWPSVNRPLSGTSWGCCSYKTPGCPLRQPYVGPTVGRAISAGHDIQANGHQVASDCPVYQVAEWWQLSALPGKEGNQLVLTVRCAPDSPIHTQKGKADCFPFEERTARGSLGAIKGPPKHPSTRVEDSQV
jgi:hypothetical protein